jgi:glycosyltransferase 2 family protein
VPPPVDAPPTRSTSARPPWRRRGLSLLRFGLAALVLVALFRLARAEDVARAVAMVGRAGWPLGLVLLPTLVAMSLDALGWRAILATLGHGVRWRSMLELRLSVEAIVLALPGGSIAGEAAKVALLERRIGVPLTVGAASLALTKLLLIASDAAYLSLIAIALAFGGWGPRSLPLLLALGGVAFTGAAALVLALVLRRSRLASRLATTLALLPSARLRRWVQGQGPRFEELDRAARAHFDSRWRTRLACFAPFMLEWLSEGLETLIIVRCLGISLGFGEALALDGLGSLLRAVVIVVPAGLGVQDAIQVLLLNHFGVSDPIATGAAFVFIKRAKEVFWIVMGLLFLAVRRDLWRRSDERT